jgi:hypothetical protein
MFVRIDHEHKQQEPKARERAEELADYSIDTNLQYNALSVEQFTRGVH